MNGQPGVGADIATDFRSRKAKPIARDLIDDIRAASRRAAIVRSRATR